jgi:hypothetical protein
MGAYTTGLLYGASTRSYYTINGIKIIRAGDITDGSGTAILLGGGSGITISNNWLETNSINAIGYSTSSGTYTKIYIHNNTIKEAGRVHITAGDARITDLKYYNNVHYGAVTWNPFSFHTDGLMIGGDGVSDYAIQGLYIYNNKWIGDWSQGATAHLYLNGTAMHCYDYINGSHEPTYLQVAVDESLVEGKLYTWTNSGGWSGSGTGSICVSTGSWHNGDDITECAIYGGQKIATLSSVASGDQALKSTKDSYIYNNLFATENDSGSALSPAGIYITSGHESVKLYNNTLDLRSNAVDTVGICVAIGYAVSNIDLQNNILVGCDNAITFNTSSSNITMDYNHFFTINDNRLFWIPGTATYTTCEALQAAGYSPNYCVLSGPKYTTLPSGGVVGSGNWVLQASSPAINQGNDLSVTFTTDIIATTRSGAWDIGAYEYSGVSGTFALSISCGVGALSATSSSGTATCLAADDYTENAEITVTGVCQAGWRNPTYSGCTGSTSVCTMTEDKVLTITCGVQPVMPWKTN